MLTQMVSGFQQVALVTAQGFHLVPKFGSQGLKMFDIGSHII
jgi:hypothetical protein